MNAINLEVALERFGNDRDIYLEMAQTCIETSDTDFQHLRMMLLSGQYEQVGAVIHRLKGGFLTLGADSFGQKAGELEKMLKTSNTIESKTEKIHTCFDETASLYAIAFEELKTLVSSFQTQT